MIIGIRQTPSEIGRFFAQPISYARKMRTFTWPAAILLQLVWGWLCGVAWLMTSPLHVSTPAAKLTAFLIFPGMVLGSASALTIFIYLLLAVAARGASNVERPLIQPLYALVILSQMAFFFLHAFSEWVPPVDLIGFAMSALILAVGLVDQFKLERRLVFRVVVLLFCISGIAWITVQLTLNS